jgi:predicted dehydrogenase
MNKGIALYVEKPFAKTEKEHLFTCSGFKPYNLAVGFQRRALGKTAIIKKIIEEGFFGKLKRISFEFGNTRASRGLSYQNNPALSGGGILFDVAIHGIDCIMFFTQAEKLVLKSKKIINDEDLNIDIHSEIEFELYDPLGSSIQCNSLISQLTNTSNNIKLKFENAELVFSLFDEEPIKILKNDLSINLTDALYGNTPSSSHQIFYSFWRSFIEGIVSEKTNLTSAINSVMTTRFIEQAYQ